VSTGARSHSRPSSGQLRDEALPTARTHGNVFMEPLDNPSPFAQQHRPVSRHTPHSSTPPLAAGVEEGEGTERGRGRSESMFRDNELPHIATLSMPPTPDGNGNGERGLGVALPPMRNAAETGAGGSTKRRSQNTAAISLADSINATTNSATPAPAPSKPPRAPNHAGPKVVACNFCRSGCFFFICIYIVY
jgi:hypothetical protein